MRETNPSSPGTAAAFSLAAHDCREAIRQWPEDLRDLRELAGMTRAEVAEIVGVTEGAVAHWEHGRCVPTPDRAYWLLEVLVELAEPNLTPEQADALAAKP